MLQPVTDARSVVEFRGAFVAAPSISAHPVWVHPSNDVPSKIVRIPAGSGRDQLGARLLRAPAPLKSIEFTASVPGAAASTVRNMWGACSTARPVTTSDTSRQQ